MADAVLVANRFVELSDATYLDLASATTVALTRCTVSDAVRVTLADEGARLCRLWHPVLAPYTDFGPLGESDWFEAVATVPMSATPVTAGRADVEAFLHAHDLRSVSLEESSLDDPAAQPVGPAFAHATVDEKLRARFVDLALGSSSHRSFRR